QILPGPDGIRLIALGGRPGAFDAPGWTELGAPPPMAGEVLALEVLAAAAAGDEQAFVQLTAPLRRRLHAHFYRMLGSVDDADDCLQETMLRAWRGIDRFEPRAELSSWLYRIATNVCLRMIERRGRWDAAAVDAYLQPY